MSYRVCIVGSGHKATGQKATTLKNYIILGTIDIKLACASTHPADIRLRHLILSMLRAGAAL